MTIPPIGSPPGSPPQPDEKANSNHKAERAETNDRARETPAPRRERVELSPEAERIRERQAEITRLQVAERTAAAIEQEARDIREMQARQKAARRAGDRGRAEITRKEIDDRIERLRERAREPNYGDENLLDGRTMKFRFDDSEASVRTPDAAREVEEFANEVRDTAEKSRQARARESFAKTRRFAAEARDVRERLEKDVRESVAGAMRESSHSRPRDAEDAERILRQVSKARQAKTNQRPAGMEQIASRAVNLLQ